MQRNPFVKELNHNLSTSVSYVGQHWNISSTPSEIVMWCPDWPTDQHTRPSAEVMWQCSSLIFTSTSVVAKASGFSPKRQRYWRVSPGFCNYKLLLWWMIFFGDFLSWTTRPEWPQFYLCTWFSRIAIHCGSEIWPFSGMQTDIFKRLFHSSVAHIS